jgi:Holliday junction resolvase RusA-like endonuclease
VSQGASSRKKRALTAELRELTEQVPWMYTGDVSVTIEWTVHLRWRYESHSAVDVDNMVKPILDAIAGPRGILIDDTQVNHVSVNWTTWTRTDRQHLKIEVRSLDLDLYEQKGFPLVEARPALFLPLPALLDNPKARGVLWNGVAKQFEAYDQLSELGASWEAARAILPIQRLFHRNKVKPFTLLTPEQYVAGTTGPPGGVATGLDR